MSRISARKIEDLLIALTIFISSIVYFKTPFEGYFHYIIFIIYLPLFITRYGPPTSTLKLLAIPTVVSLYYVAIGDNTFFNFFKIFMGVLLSSSFYYYVFVHYKFNVVRLFRLYLKGGLIVCYIGIFQAISYLIKFNPGYNFRWIFNKWGNIPGGLLGIRINSIFSEPSQFAIVISPLIFLALYNIITRKFFLLSRLNCFIIMLSLVISTSSTGYMGFLISGILLAINFKRILDFSIILIFISLGVYFLYNYVGDFRSRVDSYANIINKDKLTLDDINSSSFVQYNNFHVATTSFIKHPIVGTGLGSYQMAYAQYSLTKEKDFIIKKGFDFNSQDGNSTFIRIIVEMGLLGFIFFLILVFKCFVLKQDLSSDRFSWLVSSSMLVIILLYFIRQGNYFINGFPFFLWMYYYNWQNFKSYKKALIDK